MRTGHFGRGLKFLALQGFGLWVAVTLWAHTMGEEAFVCPIDGKKFKQMVDMSGTQFGIRLDFKPLGPTAAPWAIPQCPQCHFVLYKEDLDKTTLDKLKSFILSPAYQAEAKGNSSYYDLAKIQEFLGLDNRVVGTTYLKASWQVESDPKKCREYLALAYEKLKAGVEKSDPAEKQNRDLILLLGELERRLGQFDQAAKRFEQLKKNPGYQDKTLQEIIARQLALIAKKDSAPHALDEKQEDLLKE